MDFGLGLILSFTDRASAGLQNAVSSLNQLTNTAQNAAGQLNDMANLAAFSAIATRVGDGMMNAGEAIISTFSRVIGKVNETGQTLMFAENQLNKLYAGSDKTGKDVLKNIADYAKKSIFEYEDLIPVVTMLKANGIEAFDEIASSTGKSHQTLMDYAADLAAFNPQMRNAYGTGIKAAMGALNEYIAEGNAISLKRGASLDITSILGEEKGSTIEERSKQVADLLEKLNMVGMTAQLAQTPMTKLSNMQDTLFQFIGMISDSGVYEAYTRIIDVFAGFVNNLSDERLQSIAKTIGDSLTALMRPLEMLAKVIVRVADAFLRLIESAPWLAKFITIATALSGALLIVGGFALKTLGTIGLLTLGLKTLSTSFAAIKTTLILGAKQIIGSIAPLALTVGLLFFAWKRDLFGIRSLVTGFVDNVKQSFATAKDAVSGDVDHLRVVLSGLDKNDFFDALSIGIMKFMTLFQALREGWDDFTLSEDTFLKAKELGILPLIEAIFDLKYRFDNFKEGFKKGWNEVFEAVKNVVSKLRAELDGSIFDKIFDSITKLFQALSNNDAGAWKSVGDFFGKLAAIAVHLAPAIFLVVKAFGLLGGVLRVVSTIASGVSKVISFLATPFGAIIMVITGVITAVKSFVDQWQSGFSVVKSIIMTVGIALVAIGAIILGAPALIVGVIAAIVAVVATLVLAIKTHWEEIKTFVINTVNAIKTKVSEVWNAIKTAVVNTVVGLVTTVVSKWNEFKAKVASIVSGIKTTVSTTWSNLKSNVVATVGGLASSVIAKWTSLKSSVTSSVNKLRSTVSTAWNTMKSSVSSAGSAMKSAATSAFNTLKNSASTAMNRAKSLVSSGMSKIKGIINGAHFSMPHFKLPHFSVRGKLSLNPPSVPHISVSWYEKGGIFDKPNLIGVGENGAEAVMPLERNTEWIGMLAKQIDANMSSSVSRLTPVSTVTNNSETVGGAETQYMTNNSQSTITNEGDTDNSIIFNEGAIQINCKNASEEEAVRLAKRIMQLIKRQGELNAMTSYA